MPSPHTSPPLQRRLSRRGHLAARGRRSIALLLALGALVGAARTARADEPRAEFRLGDRDTPHVDVPFHLDLLIEGFDEKPQPDVPKLEIANARVTFVAA